MSESIQVGGIYRHYKGHIYRVVYLAKHSETLEDMVIYQDVSAPEKVWARPARMWDELVQVDGALRPRFAKIEG